MGKVHIEKTSAKNVLFQKISIFPHRGSFGLNPPPLWKFQIRLILSFKTFGLLRLLQTFAGVLPCPLGKIRMCAILKENTANYILLERLTNVDFGKKYELLVSSILQKKIAKMTAKMTMRHSIRQMN